jgi:hypothetical protein
MLVVPRAGNPDTWAEKDGRSPDDRFRYIDQQLPCEIGKAFETYHDRPTNVEHPYCS